MSSKGGSFSSASLYAETDWAVRCSAYPDTAPILSVDAGDFGVMITFADRSAPRESWVAFGRELAAETARFASECERLQALSPGNDRDAGDVADNAA